MRDFTIIYPYSSLYELAFECRMCSGQVYDS